METLYVFSGVKKRAQCIKEQSKKLKFDICKDVFLTLFPQ